MTKKIPERVRALLDGHSPTVYCDAPSNERIRCECGFRDHPAGWWAHIRVDVLEREWASRP